VQTSTTSLTIVLRLESVHRLILALLGPLYEKIYNPSGLNCGMWVLGYRENHNFIEGPICMGKERPKDSNGKTLHPTQKPLWALRHCIELASSPGDLIYDPFRGVMSTGVAALEPGRRFIGIEIDQCYFNAGKYRMSNSLQV